LAAEKLDTADPINLGSGHEIAIRDLAQTIADHVGYRGAMKFDPTQPDGQAAPVPGTTRAKVVIGFEATTSLDKGWPRRWLVPGAYRREHPRPRPDSVLGLLLCGPVAPVSRPVEYVVHRSGDRCHEEKA